MAMSSTDSAPALGFGSAAYRGYVLVCLLLVYTFNFIDRILISVVAEPLIREFQLLDWQFGLLSGFGFALLYTFLGVPIARFAETRNRVVIISACLGLWSLMTAACGLAGGFLMLLIFRVGVGIGEAGCTPPASSLIADYYPPRSRAAALGVYAMGVTLGGVLANLFGGPIAQMFSWREAFLYLGGPGLALAVLVRVTVKEPPRGHSDGGGAPAAERTGFGEAMTELASKPTYWLMTAGATIAAFTGYGLNAFQSPYLQRNLGLSVGEAAITFNVPIGLAAALGTAAAGLAIERLTPRWKNAVAWVPALAMIAASPLGVIGFSTPDRTIALVSLAVAAFAVYGYLTSQYAIGQSVVGLRNRATAIAILLFVQNLIGYGLGPLFVGFMSDTFIAANIAGADSSGALTLAACKGDLALFSDAQGAVCAHANGAGLRRAMTLTASFYAAAGLMFLLAGRTLQRDLVSGQEERRRA